MANKTISIQEKTIFDGFFIKYIFKSLIKLWFKISGWKVMPSLPEGAGITVAAPHTSNWDFIYALSSAILQDVKIYFSIKDSWCKIPIIGSIILWLGAIPIDRSLKTQGQIKLIKEFVDKHKEQRIFFIFTPEGTRGKVKKWKAGFYFMAEQCDLPIFLSKADYKKKEAGVFHTFRLTGDRKSDIKMIQAAYKSVHGKFTDDQFPAFEGPLPEIPVTEANILRAMYSFKEYATEPEIKTKIELETANLDSLVAKGLLDIDDASNHKEKYYQLNFSGKGCLLHLFSNLN